MNLINIIPQPWAILPDRLTQIIDIVNSHLRGPKLNLKGMEERILDAQVENASPGVNNTVAILPIVGPIMKNPDIFDRVFYGAVSSSRIKADFISFVEDPAVSKIILFIDSPGGTVDGTEELAEAIYENRGKKQVLAYTNGMMTSAAYWIGSAADKIYISGETANVGSIGVITAHVDYTEFYKEAGVKVTEFVTGQYKNVYSDVRPLDDVSSQAIQCRIDYILGVFAGAVIRNRGWNADAVNPEVFEAQIFMGQQAIDAGLVDGVFTLDALIDGTYSNQSAGAEAGAAIVPAQINISEEKMDLTIQILEKDFPDIYKAVFEAGRSAAKGEYEAEKSEAIKSAKAEELARVKSVKDMAVAGHEALVEKLMFDGATTGEQAAVQILRAEQQVKSEALADMKAGSHPGVSQPEPPADSKTDADSELPVEERAKAEWDKSKDLRSEFGDDFKTYLAFKKNDEAGRVRIKNGGKQ